MIFRALTTIFAIAFATTVAADRSAGEYFDLCTSATSTDDFHESLLAEGDWTPVQLDGRAADYDWKILDEWTAEKLVLASSFAFNAVRTGVSERDISEALSRFRNNLSFERQLFPVFFPPYRYEFYFDASSARIVGIDGTESGPVQRCVFAQFGRSDWQELFERFQSSGKHYGTDLNRAGMIWIKPEMDSRNLRGALMRASDAYLRDVLGIIKGDLFVFQIGR